MTGTNASPAGAYGVKANVKARHKFLRMGGLCWVYNLNPGWANERFQVVGMSRGGRIVHTWVDARDLTNYRAGWIANDPPYPGTPRFPFPSRAEAQAWADDMNRRFGDAPVREHAANFRGGQP